MDRWTHDRHNAMTIARWALASGAKNQGLFGKGFKHYHCSYLGLISTLKKSAVFIWPFNSLPYDKILYFPKLKANANMA